jgi:hypothetical protein
MINRRKFVGDASRGIGGLSLVSLFSGCGVTEEAQIENSTDGSNPASGTGLVYEDQYLDHVLIRPDGGRSPEIPERLVRIR